MKKNILSLFISLIVLASGAVVFALFNSSITPNEFGWILSGSTMGALITYLITVTGYES